MRHIILAVALLAGSAVATAEQQKVPARFNVLDFNSVANEYLPVPTFVTFKTMKKGDVEMLVEYDFYGVGEYGNDTTFTSFRGSAAEEYRGFIAKYLEWEEIAARDGDQFQKKIGRAEGVRGKLQFEFASVSASRHLLIVKFCTVGICLDEALALDREGAIGFDSMLQSLVEDGVQAVDVDEKYR